MDSYSKGPAFSISDNSRVRIESNNYGLPPKNSTLSRLGVAWLTMVVSLLVDIFPSQIGMQTSQTGGFSLSSLSRMPSSHRRQTRASNDIDAGIVLPSCQPL